MPENKIEDKPGYVNSLRQIAYSIGVKGADVQAMYFLLQGLERLENALTAEKTEKKEEI